MLALTLALLLSGPAPAQDGATGVIVQDGSTSNDEKVRFSKDALKEIQANDDAITQLLAAAQQAEPELAEAQVPCLKRQSSISSPLVQVSLEASQDMVKAMESGDDARAEHELRKLGVALGKSRSLRAQAEACTGLQSEGDTRVDPLYSGEELSEVAEPEDGDAGNDPPGTSPFE